MRDEDLRSVSPVAKAAEIFAQRWTPLFIRELLMGSRRFSERGILDAPHSPLLIKGAP